MRSIAISRNWETEDDIGCDCDLDCNDLDEGWLWWSD